MDMRVAYKILIGIQCWKTGPWRPISWEQLTQTGCKIKSELYWFTRSDNEYSSDFMKVGNIMNG
jgi:hypothetical protein